MKRAYENHAAPLTPTKLRQMRADLERDVYVNGRASDGTGTFTANNGEVLQLLERIDAAAEKLRDDGPPHGPCRACEARDILLGRSGT